MRGVTDLPDGEIEVGNQVVFVPLPEEMGRCQNPECGEELDVQAIYWTTYGEKVTEGDKVVWDKSGYIVNNDCPKCGRTVSVPWS